MFVKSSTPKIVCKLYARGCGIIRLKKKKSRICFKPKLSIKIKKIYIRTESVEKKMYLSFQPQLNQRNDFTTSIPIVVVLVTNFRSVYSPAFTFGECSGAQNTFINVVYFCLFVCLLIVYITLDIIWRT